MPDKFAAQDWLIWLFDTHAGSIWSVPSPYPHEPRFLTPAWFEERPLHNLLASVGLILTKEGRARYWEQVLKEGQGYDDATGFRSRCWAAAFNMPFKPAWESCT